jgi:hypothetical protein
MATLKTGAKQAFFRWPRLAQPAGFHEDFQLLEWRHNDNPETRPTICHRNSPHKTVQDPEAESFRVSGNCRSFYFTQPIDPP